MTLQGKIKYFIFIDLLSLPLVILKKKISEDFMKLVIINTVNLRPIFTTRMAFSSTYKDKLPIFKQSRLMYKCVCRCSSTYTDRTCQRPEVRIRQHVPKVILSKGRQISGHSQAMDLAIGEHFLTINTCRTSKEDDCFSILHRARDKIHLKVLEAIYIAINHSSVQTVKQSYFKYFLGTVGDYVDLIFFSPRLLNPIIEFTPRFFF